MCLSQLSTGKVLDWNGLECQLTIRFSLKKKKKEKEVEFRGSGSLFLGLTITVTKGPQVVKLAEQRQAHVSCWI